jgi:hypothetical protein
MAFTESLDAYFLDFGIVATVGGVVVEAIFDNQFATSLGFAAGTSPILLVQSAAVPLVALGTAVTIGAASYTVTAIEPDGTGLTLLRLAEA